MLLIDTSVWIRVFRDRSDQIGKQLETLIAKRKVLLTEERQRAEGSYAEGKKFSCMPSATFFSSPQRALCNFENMSDRDA